MEIIIGIAFLVACVIIIISALKNNSNNINIENSKIKAGKRGEERAITIIESVLREGDYLFSNIDFIYDDRPAELDCVVVNKYGVFIIEVKNYVGYIVGNEDDYEWKKYKITDAKNTYYKSVKNPIKQVKRQVYLLAKYLDYYGVNVWVKGYALLMHGNSPVDSEYILSSIDEIDKAIHTKNKNFLSKSTIESIKNILQ